ncbi:hypothetical protein D9M70_513860 [compost metagenome]
MRSVPHKHYATAMPGRRNQRDIQGAENDLLGFGYLLESLQHGRRSIFGETLTNHQMRLILWDTQGFLAVFEIKQVATVLGGRERAHCFTRRSAI